MMLWWWMMMDFELEVLKSYVKMSKYRFKVLKILSSDYLKIPSQISMETGIRKNHISKVLRDLKTKDLIECINEDSKKGRLYRLTSTGEQVKNELFPQTERYVNRDGIIYDSKRDKYIYIDDTIDLLNSQDNTIKEYYNILLS